MNTIKLEKGIIYHLLPFRLGSGKPFDLNNFEIDIWTKTDEDVSRLDFLLEHAKEFFTKNTKPGKEDESACIIMKLKPEALPVKIFNNKPYWLSNKPFDSQPKSGKLLKLPVSFDPGNFRIIFHPFTRVGILLFSTELAGSGKNKNQGNMSDFIQMNYLLRLFNRHDEAFFISQNERTEERSKASQFVSGKTADIFERTDPGNIELTGWRPRHLINYLLQDLNSSYEVEFFDHFHLSPICYVHPSEEICDASIIHRTLFYLRKVYDFDYTPASDLLQRDGELLHPYKQIYYAASLEGGVVLNNCSSKDPEFIRTFYSNSFQKTLWLTILGDLQRTIFLQLMKEVSDIDPDDHLKVKEYLKRYTTISLKAIFSKVSIYHQHNDYYELIIHNLQINELQTELKDELNGLNNLQRQFHEDEVERHEKIEKQHDKKLNMTLFALSIFGLTQITYAVLGNLKIPLYMHLLAIGIPLFLGFIFWKMLSVHKK